MEKVKFIVFVVLFGFLFVDYPIANQFQEFQCVEVIDGDTIIMERNGVTKRSRLLYIDSPEIKQLSLDNKNVGEWSKKHLENLILNKTIYVKSEKLDMYNRSLSEIFLGEKNINLAMISDGYAIVYLYSKFASFKDKQKYILAFKLSMNNKKGIWRTKGILNPYNFRKKKPTKKRRLNIKKLNTNLVKNF